MTHPSDFMYTDGRVRSNLTHKPARLSSRQSTQDKINEALELALMWESEGDEGLVEYWMKRAEALEKNS